MTSYPLSLPNIELTIEGVDYQDYLLSRSLVVRQFLGSQVDTATFTIKQPETWRSDIDSIKPSAGQEVIVKFKTDAEPSFSNIFGGLIESVRERRIATANVVWDVTCTDYSELLNRQFVVEQYRSTTVSAIVTSLIQRYAPSIDISEVQTSGVPIAGISFNYRYPSECLDELAQISGWEWFIDADKKLQFFAPGTTNHISSNSLTDTSRNYYGVTITPRVDQVRNRVYVDGGASLSDPQVEIFTTNGSDRTWSLRNRDIVSASIFLDEVSKTIGEQGTVDESLFDFLLVKDSGDILLSSHTATPNPLSTLRVEYTYRYDLATVVEDIKSQNDIAALSVDYPALVNSYSPTRYYRLGDTSGTTATDQTGSYNGTYAQAGTAPLPGLNITGAILGDTDTAVQFNLGIKRSEGNYNYMSASGDTDLNFNPDDRNWVLCAWVKVIDMPSATFGTIAARSQTSDSSPDWHLVVSQSSGGGLGIVYAESIAGHLVGYMPNDGQYHMVMVVYESQISDKVRLYIDGELQDEGTTLNTDSAGDLVVGTGRTNDDGSILDGIVDELWICNVADSTPIGLTDQAIARLYAEGRETGIRETRVNDNSLDSLEEARTVGKLELAKWSSIITELAFTSYVSGWKVGDLVTVNLSTSETGRTFSGTALVQSITLITQGAQRIRYDVKCSSARFDLIDFWKQLARSNDTIPGKVEGTLEVIRSPIQSPEVVLHEKIQATLG